MGYSPPLSVELAQRAFDADCAFSAALAAFQAQSHQVTALAALLVNANQHGFSWIIKPKPRQRDVDDFMWEVSLRHANGAEECAYGNNVEFLLCHLLGFPLLNGAQADEPEKMQDPHKAQESQQEAAVPAAEVVPADAEPEPVAVAQPEPEPQGDHVWLEPTAPLTEQQKAAALEMVKVMNAEQRKAFTISFRSAFQVPREVKAIAPLITELQHLHFVDRFTVEAAGGIAP